MPTRKLFATPIYSDALYGAKRARETARFNREIREQCEILRETDDEGREWSEENYRHGYTSYGSIDDLHLRFPHFEDLARAINPHVKRFARELDWDLQGGKLVMSSCWVNVMPSDAAHSLHLHPLSVVSGTYYVRVPKGASQIKFEDPRLASMMASPPKKHDARDDRQLFYKLSPKEGDVVLWESWLRHEVPPNSSREERISISFNYDWR